MRSFLSYNQTNFSFKLTAKILPKCFFFLILKWNAKTKQKQNMFSRHENNDG
jgi:hypothetical protein